ncbi:MAG: thioredoxin domain-containing protein, partial [Methanobacterium sp.]
YLITEDIHIREISNALEKYFSPMIEQSPSAFTMFLSAIILKRGLSFKIAITGEKDSADTKNMLNALYKKYLPDCMLILRSSDDTLINQIIESSETNTMMNNKATAYVCGNGTCHAPVNTPEDLVNLLK